MHLDHRDDVGEVHVPQFALPDGDIVDKIRASLIDRDVECETVAFFSRMNVVIYLCFGVSYLLVHLGDFPDVISYLVFLIGAEHEPETGFGADQEFDLSRGDKRISGNINFPDVGFLAFRNKNVDAGPGSVHGVVYLIGDISHAVAFLSIIFADLFHGVFQLFKAQRLAYLDLDFIQKIFFLYVAVAGEIKLVKNGPLFDRISNDRAADAFTGCGRGALKISGSQQPLRVGHGLFFAVDLIGVRADHVANDLLIDSIIAFDIYPLDYGLTINRTTKGCR